MYSADVLLRCIRSILLIQWTFIRKNIRTKTLFCVAFILFCSIPSFLIFHKKFLWWKLLIITFVTSWWWPTQICHHLVYLTSLKFSCFLALKLLLLNNQYQFTSLLKEEQIPLYHLWVALSERWLSLERTVHQRYNGERWCDVKSNQKCFCYYHRLA